MIQWTSEIMHSW